MGNPSSCNYFEPTADGKGVKNILIFQVQAGETKDGLKQRHLQSIINLKNLLKGARQTKVGTTYLQRAEEEFKIGEEEEVMQGDSIAPPLASEQPEEEKTIDEMAAAADNEDEEAQGVSQAIEESFVTATSEVAADGDAEG